MNDDIYLGCDIGTGSCKVIAYTEGGKFLKETRSFYTVQHPQKDYAVQDPFVVESAFFECLREMTAFLPKPPSGLGFSSCMHSLILVDKANKPTTSMLTWEDNRSHKIAAELKSQPRGIRLYENTGTPIHSMSPLCKIAWFKDNEPQIFSEASRFIGIKEFIWYRMFHTYEVDHSIASATGLFNLRTLMWDKGALSFAGIDEGRLSAPVNTTFVRRNPANVFLEKTGLPHGMSFCIGASDGCMANAGSRIENIQDAALTVGTSGAIRITSPKPLIDSSTMLFNYILDENRYVVGGPVNNGGNVQQLMIQQILGIQSPGRVDYEQLETSISTIPAGSDGVVCVPWFYGERAPVWNGNAKGMWYGVSGQHNKFHLIRAALEGVSFTLKMILNRIETLSKPIKQLHAGGGFTNSAEWVKMMADITRKPVLISEGPDASAKGAVMWALKSTTGKDLPEPGFELKRIEPNKNNEMVYEKNFEVFAKLVEVGERLRSSKK